MRDTRSENMTEIGRVRGDRARGGCSVSGCDGVVMGGKPHCIKHIDQSPHAKRVIEAKTKRSKELSTATKPEGWRTIDVNGSRAREIIAKLKLMGAMSPSNLATQVELGKTTIEAYLVALEAAGLVKVEKLRSARYVTRRVVIAVEKDD